MSFGFHPLPLNLCPSLRSRQLVCAGQAVNQFLFEKKCQVMSCTPRPVRCRDETRQKSNNETKEIK